MPENKVFTEDNLPEDAVVNTSQSYDYEPIDDSETYTVQVLKVALEQNNYWKEGDPNSNKYVFSFQFAILDDNKYYGRRLFDRTTLTFKPTTKKGQPKLHKIVTKALKTNLDWDQCASFGADVKVLFHNLQEQIVGKQLKVAIEGVSKEDGKIVTKIRSYSEVKTELPSFDEKKSKEVAEKNAKRQKEQALNF